MKMISAICFYCHVIKVGYENNKIKVWKLMVCVEGNV